jgi:hypothetical protein
MKKILFFILLILIGAYISGLWFTWYSLIFTSLIAGFLIRIPVYQSWIWSFIAVFVLYLVKALWIDHANNSILSSRIGLLFNDSSVATLAILSGLSGGLLAGFSSATGTSLRNLLTLKK